MRIVLGVTAVRDASEPGLTHCIVGRFFISVAASPACWRLFHSRFQLSEGGAAPAKGNAKVEAQLAIARSMIRAGRPL
ncbi:hypothetical protein [Mesorhizobium sp.]|uniref:hypothetical protein n=1 Tax=Mesorhizobium sp. TaxID=1871066 RepID=UPI000FE457C6|nr:hypothetical protein [Mesorhizobium sp.]RWO25438.1 MAG: hypothetical protein EOS09_10710 [Mesorhizobium sp.]